MIYRLLIIALATSLVIYYVAALLQYADVIRFTGRKITFGKLLIPFYYLINTKKTKKHGKRKH